MNGELVTNVIYLVARGGESYLSTSRVNMW